MDVGLMQFELELFLEDMRLKTHTTISKLSNVKLRLSLAFKRKQKKSSILQPTISCTLGE